MLNNNKIIVIGIDGATFKIIDPLVKEGRLPNIAKMLKNGVRGILSSTIPPVSPVAWTSFMTGKNPGRHGIYDFAAKIPGSYRFEMNTAKNRKAEPVWVNLSRENKRVLVIGVTMTYPPDSVNGYMISGLGAPADSDQKSCFYPPELTMEITNNFGKYNTVPEADLRKLNDFDKEKERYLKGIFEQIEYRVKLFKYMWQKEPFDFSMIFFLDTDGISHYFWKYMDKSHKGYFNSGYSEFIYKVYEKVDNAIGELLGIIADTADIILVSDHGFGPLNRVIFLNNWLESNGYLKFKKGSKLKVLLSKFIFLPRRKRIKIKKEIDWQRTKAYFSGTVGYIFINLKGREPEGIVDATEYDDLCNRIKMELLNLEDPETNKRIIDNIYRRDELFNNKDLIAPDLLVTFKSGYSIVGDEIGLHGLKHRRGIMADSNNWSGTHEPDGIFIAHGKNFKRGYTVQGARIIDIAPNVLSMLGVPIPESMDGRFLQEIFTEEFLRVHKISYSKDTDTLETYQNDIERSDDEILRKQLRNLGYID